MEIIWASLSRDLTRGGVFIFRAANRRRFRNPALPLFQGASWGLIATIWAGYGVNFSALFYALIVAQQLLVAEASSPGWFSVRLLGPFCASATVLAAALMWLNLRR